MLKVYVELLAFVEPIGSAFGDPVRRPVVIPGPDIDLDEVFRLGQNDFAPLPMPSASTGDVIVAPAGTVCAFCRRWLILPVGFRELNEAEYYAYRGMPRRDRHFSALLTDVYSRG